MDRANSDRVIKVSEALVSLDLPRSNLVLVMSSDTNIGADLPYHNWAHCVTVGLRALEGAIHHGLSIEQQRELLLAGMWHDFDYILDIGEVINIRAATDGWLEHGAARNPHVDPDEVVRIIRSTHFPHGEPNDISEAIIQDADMMQHLEPDAEVFYEGLGRERGAVINGETTREFISSVHINTDWAKGLLSIP